MDVAHTFERAASGRAKCRGCGRSIAKGELRFGERLPNPFAEGEMTLWYHPRCAAYARPEALLETLASAEMNAEERTALEAAARWSSGHRRLPRIHGAERAPTGQAKCRSCRQPIARGAWRVRLRFLEEGRPQPGGFIHLECRKAYFETEDIADAVLHFSPDLDEAERAELVRALR
jgi:ribosomal protein L37AE/L43A